MHSRSRKDFPFSTVRTVRMASPVGAALLGTGLFAKDIYKSNFKYAFDANGYNISALRGLLLLPAP